MQVQSSFGGPAAEPWAANRPLLVAGAYAGDVLLPELLKATGPTPQAQALRARRAADQRRQPRSEEPADSAALAANAAQSPAQVIQAAEREMAPGSRTARRELQAGLARQETLERHEFRRSLQDAAQREGKPSAPAARQSAAPAAAQRSADALPAAAAKSPAAAPGGNEAAGGGGVQDPAMPPTIRSSPPAAQSVPPPAQYQAALAAGPRPGGLTRPGGPTGVAGPGAVRLLDSAAGGGRHAASEMAARRASGPGAAPAVRHTSPTPAGPAEGRAALSRAAAAAARPGRAPAAEPGDSDANIARMVRVIRSQLGPQHARASLRLDPPELGTVRLHMDLQSDVLSLRIETQTALAHRLLSEQLDALRQGLEATGIQLERVEVRPPPVEPPARDPGAGAGGAFGQPPGGEQQSPARSASGQADGAGRESVLAAAELPGGEREVPAAAESRVNLLA